MSTKITRILMVTDHIDFGGGGSAVFCLERAAYEAAGYEVYTFSQCVEIPTCATDRDFVAIESKSRIGQKAGKFLSAPGISRSFRQALQSIQPQFISVHLVSKYPLSIYPQLGGYPVVQTLHGPNLFCATSWGCLKNGAPCELGVGAKCFTRGCTTITGAGLYTFLYKRLLESIKNNVDLFICPSTHLLESAESLGFEPATFIPLGIDESFNFELIAEHNGPPVILFVGSLSEAKGVHILLEAFRSVVERVADAQLQIAGRGVMADVLQKQVTDYGLTDSVKFLGFVEHSDVSNLYREASVLAVPSIWKEQFGLVGPEALACGLPCVGSNFGGIPEWLRDGEWGFTVPPRDPITLADKIVTLLDCRKLRREFGARGRAWALNQYSPEKYKESRLSLVKDYAGVARMGEVDEYEADKI